MSIRTIAIVTLWMSITYATSVFAQDHSQHRSNPSTEPQPATKQYSENEDHSAHATPSAAKDTARKDSFLSEERHVPPDPPQHVMAEMSEKRMMELMEMDDTSNVGRVLVDQLEGYDADSHTALAWDAQGWYGGDYNKVWMKTEGERVAGVTKEAEAELLWNRIFARWWSIQTGVRHDFGEGPSRTWGAIGIEGLAPYWFDVEATLYVGGGGRAAAKAKVEYDLLFTQRLILQPELELNLLSKDDPERNLGAGLTDFEFGLRLRYEFRREIAPYVGLAFTQRVGDTADLVRAAGENSSDLRVVMGVRFSF
jgi:copper resistance protein B